MALLNITNSPLHLPLTPPSDSEGQTSASDGLWDCEFCGATFPSFAVAELHERTSCVAASKALNASGGKLKLTPKKHGTPGNITPRDSLRHKAMLNSSIASQVRKRRKR